MGCPQKRGRKRDRWRDLPGQGSRKRVMAESQELIEKKQKRHERYLQEKVNWSCHTRKGRSDRNLRRLIRYQVSCIEKACAGSVEVASKLLEGIVGHWRLKNARTLTSFKSTREMMARELVAKNLFDAGTSVRGQHSQDDVIAKSVLCNMAMSKEVVDARLVTEVGKLFNMSRHSLGKHGLNRELILGPQGRVGNWAVKGRAQRKDALAKELQDFIIQYWTDKTRPSPCAKHVFKKHPIHFLHITQTELYLQFREEFPVDKFPGIKSNDKFLIGQRRFEMLKPKFIRAEKDRTVCCCKYHVEMNFLKDALNTCRRGHGQSCDCNCTICSHPRSEEGEHMHTGCSAANAQFSSVRDMVHSTLCPKSEDDLFYKLECIQGCCPHCGIFLNFKFCEKDLCNALSLKWKAFGYESVGKDDNGKDKMRIQLQHKETSHRDFMDYFCGKVPQFLEHDFTARWQDGKFRQCLANFPPGVIVSVIDFAENYSIANQDEIQSQHWTSEQISILVHIVYFHAPESTIDNRIVKKECHYYISDDRGHDSYFVQHCFSLLQKWLKESNVDHSLHWVWSDGAPTQFKNNLSFYFIARYAAITLGEVRMFWFFFGTGHGKGEHDGMGAIIKRWLRHYQLDRHGRKLTCAADAVELLRENLSRGMHSFWKSRLDRSRQIQRVYWLVSLQEIAHVRGQNLAARTVEGTKRFHSIMGGTLANPRVIYTREFACFCSACIIQNWEECENKSVVGDGWSIHDIVPMGAVPEDILHDEEDEVDPFYLGDGADHNNLSFALEVGSYFAVQANEEDEGALYYLLQCTGERESLRRGESDSWSDQEFLRGDMIVRGRYLESVGNTRLKYRFCKAERGDAIIFSHLVRAIDLQLVPECEREMKRWRRKKGPSAVYDLPPESHEAILKAVEDPSDLALP